MVLLCVVLIIAMLLMLVQSSKVQTAVLEVVTHKVSENLNTRIDIEKIAYSFPNRLTINGIYIEDEQQDTLLWVDTLQARFEATGFFHKRIIFSKATLKHVYANAYTIDPSKETSRMNYDFLLDLLPEQQSDSSQMQEVVEVKNVSLRDVRLRYDDWRVRDMEADLALNRLSSDSLDAEVNHLSLTLNDAFFIKELQTRAILTEDKAQIRNLLVSLPNSTLSLYGSVEHSYRAAENDSVAQSGNMFTRLFNLQRLETAQANLKIRTASITPSDIGLFVPALKNIKGQTMFNTTVTGTIGDIFIDDLEFDYKGTRILSGDVSVRGLPDIKSAFINAELLDLALDYALIQDFVSDLKGKPFFLPQEVARLGRMHYSGILKGRQDSLVLNGLFASGLGNISTDGYLLTDTTDQQMTFRGIVATPRFNLGRMLGQKDIGSLAMRAQLDGKVGEKQPLEAKLNAIVQSFQLKGYTYRNATIEGMYRKNDFEGQISIADDNIAFDFDGLVDMTGEVPVANFDLVLHHLRLAELNLTNKYADMDISAKMVMNASGDNLDNFNGYLAIDSLYLQRAEKELLMRQLYITAESGNEQERTSLKINSDFLNASFSGYYKYSQIPLAIERLVAKHTPQMLSLKTRKKLEQTPAGNDMI